MTNTPQDPKKDNGYFIKDSSAEVVRVVELERLLTRGLGGLLPEHNDVTAFLAPMQRVLDVACGAGGWSLDIAQQYPHLEVMGFDIDPHMITYATSQAQAGQLENTSFKVLNALDPLSYPDNFFDLVNARYLAVIRKDAWARVIQELVRVTRPGGTIRLTEVEEYSISNKPAFEQLSALFLKAELRDGLGLSPTGRTSGQTVQLARFLRNAGCQNIERKPFVIDWSTGMEEHEATIQVLGPFIKLIQPFLVKTKVATQEELDRLYHEMEIEMQSEDFCALWRFLTVWGQKPL